MEFDFTIEYKQGQDNMAADALSRVQSSACYQVLVHQGSIGYAGQDSTNLVYG